MRYAFKHERANRYTCFAILALVNVFMRCANESYLFGTPLRTFGCVKLLTYDGFPMPRYCFPKPFCIYVAWVYRLFMALLFARVCLPPAQGV